MSRSRNRIPGYAAVLISLLPAGLVFWLQLLTITALAETPVTATLLVAAATWMFTSTAILSVWITRIRAQARDLQRRLDVALTDPVTGLAVRRVAEDVITAAGPHAVLTVALTDVDRLHDINHGPGGYATGDRYLTETGHRLLQATTDGDLVARLGGDEFVLITRRMPRDVAIALTAAFAEPTTVGAGTLPLGVSIGISCFFGGDPHQLLGRADLAMLTAKQRRTRIEIYDPGRDGQPAPPGVRPENRPRSGQ